MARSLSCSLVILLLLVGVRANAKVDVSSEKTEPFEDANLGYDARVEPVVSNNFGIELEELADFKSGLRKQLFAYIPSTEVFSRIGGYLPPQESQQDYSAVDILVQVPRARLDLQVKTVNAAAQRLSVELFSEPITLSYPMPAEESYIAVDRIKHSAAGIAFARRCSETAPPPKPEVSSNESIEILCAVTLPQINFLRNGAQQIVFERGSGSGIVYSEKRQGVVTAFTGSNVVSYRGIEGEARPPYYFPRISGIELVCSHVGTLSVAPATIAPEDKARCLHAAADPDAISPDSAAAGQYYTTVQNILDKELLRLTQKKTSKK